MVIMDCGQWTSVLCGLFYIFSGKSHLKAVRLHLSNVDCIKVPTDKSKAVNYGYV